MTNDPKPLSLWPFLLMDALFLALALVLWEQSHRPLVWWEAAGLVICAVGGAGVFLTPFLIRNSQRQTFAQAQELAGLTEKMQKLDELASQISAATAHWKTIQDASAKTVQIATDLGRDMAVEAQAFTEFLQKANDSERSHLRLEAEKLRRSEGEWVQIVVRILDQVHALFQAAAQSGQTSVAEQIGHFQNACREISRRAGLMPLTAPSGEMYDPKRHQLGPDQPAAENALILDTLLPGYTYQGHLVRRPLVRLQPVAPLAA